MPRQPDPWRTALTLVPHALALAVPVGLMIGTAIGLAGHPVSMRLATAMAAMALVCSSGSVANLGWLVPNANQVLRTKVFQTWSQRPLAKGENELTLVEMEAVIERARSFPVGSNEWHNLKRLRTNYHTRWALAFATSALALFATSLAACTRRRWTIAIGVAAAPFGYLALQYIGWVLAFDYNLPPPAAAWLPNVVLVLMSAALQRIGPAARTRSTHRHVPPTPCWR